MNTWIEVEAWRRATRAELLERRRSVPRVERLRVQSVLNARLRDEFPELLAGQVGFYWPIKGEIDLRPLAGDLLKAGCQVALPVITRRNEPLAFARWHPQMRMDRGIGNIPVPEELERIQPTALVIPVLGFDRAGYRLGYGGGYYDRTLAGMNPKPWTLGVGYEFGRLETIYPQAHDIALDVIATESTSIRRRASPQT